MVMDIQMPGLSGVAATREISRVAPAVAVLMLTMFDDDDSVFAAMRAGARGYVLKGAQQDEIARAIQAAAPGEAIFGTGIARRVLGLASAPPVAGVPFPELTGRNARSSTSSRPRAQRHHCPALVNRPQDRRQSHLRDLHQAPGGGPERSDHPGQGRGPGPR
jgi:DNA-binding NarL/FixJ family response regulator